MDNTRKEGMRLVRSCGRSGRAVTGSAVCRGSGRPVRGRAPPRVGGRPETTNGTVNSDLLEHFVPGFRRTTTVERVLGSPWPS